MCACGCCAPRETKTLGISPCKAARAAARARAWASYFCKRNCACALWGKAMNAAARKAANTAAPWRAGACQANMHAAHDADAEHVPTNTHRRTACECLAHASKCAQEQLFCTMIMHVQAMCQHQFFVMHCVACSGTLPAPISIDVVRHACPPACT